MARSLIVGTRKGVFLLGRRGKDYYKLADQWLRSEVEASRIERHDPLRAAELMQAAGRAQNAMREWSAA